MKPIPDCVPDALSMIIAAAKVVSDEDFIHRKVLLKVMGEIADDGDLGNHPADVYLNCWEIACRALGVRDPYENEKARGAKAALGILKTLEDHPPPGATALERALRISYAGVMTNYTGLGRGDIQDNVMQSFLIRPVRDDSAALLQAAEKAESVMLVAHRAGEVVLDKPLVETLADMGKKVYLAVSVKPIFSIATEKDAANGGFSGRIEVINPGTTMFGLMQDRASSEFRAVLSEVDLVIIKGHTHFSTMAPQREFYYILKAAQEEVAAALEVPLNAGVIVKVPAVNQG